MFRKPLAVFIDQDEDEGLATSSVSLEELKKPITPTPSIVDCKSVTTPTTTKHGAQGTVIIGCPDQDKVYKKTVFKHTLADNYT